LLPAATRVDEESRASLPDAPRAPIGGRRILPALAVLALLAIAGGVALAELDRRAQEDKERRFFEAALASGHDARAVLADGEALPERIRARPAVLSAIAGLRSEVAALDAAARAASLLAGINEETPPGLRLETAERALAALPGSARALVERARARLALGRGEAARLAAARSAALEDLERAVLLDGSSAAARFELASLLALAPEGRARERAELERVSALEPASVLGALARSRVALLDGKVDDAIAALGPACDPGPSGRSRGEAALPALLLRARIRVSTNRDPAAAVADAEAALAIREKSGEARLLRAWARTRLGGSADKAALLADLDRAVEADPASAEALAHRATFKHRSSDLAGSTKDVNAARALDPNDQAVLVATAELLVLSFKSTNELSPDRRQLGQARAFLLQALALDPISFDALNVAALVAVALDDKPGALELADRTLALDPRNGAVLGNRAILLGALGRTEESGAAFDLAVERCPDAETLRFLRARFRLDTKHDWAGALDDLTRFLDVKPDHAEGHYLRGIALHQLGRFQEAVAELDGSERLNPRAPYLALLRRYRDDARARLGAR
jgi:regulator of sirC expression with transglutaminase-like and TPR domain